MKGNSVYKIPEGKLIKIELEHENKKIIEAKITGDFFIHPETGIEEIEKALCSILLEEKEIINAVNNAVKSNSLELFGVTSEGIATAIIMAGGETQNE
jgi:lipoate---protein ligase